MIVYFSGTGNSRYCALSLAQQLDDTATDTLPLLKANTPASLTSDKPWVFVCPTYAWQLPRLFEGFLRAGQFSGNKNAYFVMTCGAEIGNAGKALPGLCKAMGLTYQGVLPVVMPDNYIIMFPSPTQTEIDTMMQAVPPVLERAAGSIRAGEPFPAPKVGFLDKVKSGPVNAGFYRFQIKTKPFMVSDACTGCGKCVKGCPLNNITLQDDLPVWGSRCTHCMACLSLCPTEAIEYGKATVGKARYRCPQETP